MSNSVTLYTEQTSMRLEYIANHIFHTILEYDVQITSDKKTFLKSSGLRINYSSSKIENAIQVTPYGLLNEKGVRPQCVECFDWDGLPAFFATDGDIPFDFFSAAFFLITRYEEYLPTPLDEHGRYMHQNSAAYRNGFLRRPLVDLWAYRFAALVDEGHIVHRKFKWVSTIDVDNFYKYRRKGICGSIALFLRDAMKGNLHEMHKRWWVLTHRLEDPYFNFGALQELHEHYRVRPRYFFHVGGCGHWDMHVLFPLWCVRYRRMVKAISSHYHIGVHPSYKASRVQSRLEHEKRRLSHWVGREIKRSRFHFLRMTLPDSYRKLLDAGIMSDYSMLYAGAIGFRASTSIPFHFYDVERDEIKNLRIHPIALMDRTLMRLREEGSKDLFAQVESMLEDVRKVSGQFVTLYHNQNLTYEHETAWNKKFYESLLRLIS